MMGNGQVERANRIIQGLLRTLKSIENKKWPMHIDKLIHAYNNTLLFYRVYSILSNVSERIQVTN